MATVFRTKDKNGKPHPRWRFKYRDHLGVRRTATGTTSKRQTERLANDIQAKQNRIREGLEPPPRARMAQKPFSEVVEEYLAWGAAQGGRHGHPWSARHAKRRQAILKWWKEKLKLELLQDLEGILAEVEKVLREYQAGGRTGKSLQNQAEALAAFCDWCEEREFFEKDPLRRLVKFDVTPVTVRRALSIEEIHRLLEVSPPERRLTYEVALATAFRANELRSLTVASLDVVAGGLHLEARAAKNGKRAFQPLPAWLVEKLVQSVVGRASADRLLHVPGSPSEMIRRDFEKAGIARITSEGKADFHALRATAATLADDNGGSVKDVQEFARHSTPQMTYSHYVKARTLRLSALAERIGAQLQDPRKSCPTVVESGTGSPEVSSASSVSAESSVADGERSLEGSIPSHLVVELRTEVGRFDVNPGHQHHVVPGLDVESRTRSGFIGTTSGHEICPTVVEPAAAIFGFSGWAPPPVVVATAFSGFSGFSGTRGSSGAA